MAGKWHLTNNETGNYVHLKPEAASLYGFDYVAPRGEGTQNEGDKWVDHLTDEAIGFIEKHRDDPWFFYLSHHTVHNIVSAPAELVEKHLAKGAPATGNFNATYLASIEHLDNSIGRLTAALDKNGLRENTLVVFLSDNGGIDTTLELPGAVGEPIDTGEPLTIKDKQYDNAPLREGKGSPYEGGIRVPCIVRWPSVIKPESVSTTPVHVIDWLPTLFDAAGTTAPHDTTIDGTSLVPLFKGKTIPPRPLYWHMPLYDLRWAATPCTVLRQGDWKLIEFFGDSFDAEMRYQPGRRLELYNLADDIGEQNNLSATEPERAKAMSGQIHAWLSSIPTPIPGKNPHFDPKRMFEETREKQPWNP